MTHNQSAHSELLDALRQKDAEKVKGILDAHRGDIDLDKADPMNSFDTPVHVAIEKGDIASLQLLLEAGAKAEPAEKEEFGPGSPLMQAIESSGNRVNPKMIALLLKHGADPNAVQGDFLEQRPLLMAAEKGYESIVVMLIEAGAEVTQKDNRGNTALGKAAEKGHAGVIRILFAEGADINAHDWLDRSPLEAALSGNRREAFETLLELGADIQPGGRSKSTLLMFAAQAGEASLMDRFVKMGFKVNTQNANGDTALHFASWTGRGDSTDKLLSLGADKSITNGKGQTAAQIAEQEGHIHIVRQLNSHELRIGTEMKAGLTGGMNVAKPLTFARRG